MPRTAYVYDVSTLHTCNPYKIHRHISRILLFSHSIGAAENSVMMTDECFERMHGISVYESTPIAFGRWNLLH